MPLTAVPCSVVIVNGGVVNGGGDYLASYEEEPIDVEKDLAYFEEKPMMESVRH